MSDLISKYPIHHLLRSLQQKEISISEVETRINGYMQAIAIKAKGEAKLEYINQAYKGSQKSPEVDYRRLKDLGIDSY